MQPLSVYRNDFPVTESYIYLNHASVSPLPRRTAAAMRGLIDDQHRHGSIHYREWSEAGDALRRSAAELIHSSPDEIAVVKNTSEGLSVIANGLDWKPGDIVVGVSGEFPANYFPWKRLDRRGVKLRWVEQRNGRVALDDLDKACRGARLLAISFVQYLSGFRIDLDAVGEICGRHGCLLVVDAVQGLGPFPVDVKKSGVHALSAAAHKWLLGPEGLGILFVDRDLIPEVEPIEFGWTNVAGWPSYSLEEKLAPGAARYECGTPNTSGCFGLRASIDLFLEVGAARMASHIDHLADLIVAGAREKGYEPMTARDEQCGSGIVSLARPDVDAVETAAMLMEHGVSVSPRAGRIRAAPHFYQTEEEVRRFVDLLP